LRAWHRAYPLSYRHLKEMMEERGVSVDHSSINNIIEQDHRAIKRLTRPMLNFKSFRAARHMLAGIELMHMIRKCHFAINGTDAISFGFQFYALAGRVGVELGLTSSLHRDA